MKLPHLLILLATAAAAIALNPGTAVAADIAYASGTSGAEVLQWRTPSTAKTLDLDGDNCYGSFAAVQWTIVGVNQQAAGSTTPGWAYLGTGAQHGPYPARLDNVSGGADVGATIALSGFAFEMTGVAATYAGMTLRVGIMEDMLASNEWTADQFKALRIYQTTGGSGDSGVIPIRGGGSGDGVPEMYFFDLTNVSPGDRFQIESLNGVGGAAVQAGYVGPVSWDVALTAPQAPAIASAPASEVRSGSATLNAELSERGSLTTTVWVCWGDDDAGKSLAPWDHKVDLGTLAAGPISHPVSGLTTNTICHYRFYAVSTAGESWSEAQSFTPTLPQLAVSAGQALEGGSGLTDMTFAVTLSYPADSDITLNYSTIHLSTDDNDLTPATGQVTIPAGAASATITIRINGDADEESDEQFKLLIDQPAGVLVTVGEAQGMILSDDGEHLSPVAVASAPATGLVYVALQTARRIAVVTTAGEQFLRSIPLPDVPNGLCLNATGTRLYVASGVSAGQVHVIDTTTDALLASWNVGHTPLSPVLSPNGNWLYLCNRFNDDVSVIEVATGTTVARIPVEREPHAAAITPDGRKLFVANLLAIGPATSGSIAAHVTVIDTSTRTVTGQIALPTGSHSLRGICLAPDGGSLYVSHILSRYYAPTTQVTRGWMNTNALTVINPAAATRVNTILLDDLDEGTANPWGVACSADGAWLCVAHAGTHEISAIDRVAFDSKLAAATRDLSTDLTWLAGLRQRLPLGGNGPRGITVAGGKVFAAEYFSDSLGVADLPLENPAASREVVIGWRKPADVVRRGEMFYNDATLCLQKWQSCASCHPDARSDGLNWDLINDGFGNAKNSKSHIASMATPPAMATGIRANAEIAVRAGFRYIQFVNRNESYAQAVDAYLTALQAVPSPYLVGGQLSAAAQRGQVHFRSSGCATCHSGPEFTNLLKYEMGTGIGREAGWKFDTPTLLELWRSGPYMHDGRSATLRDVITTEAHGTTAGLLPAEIDELVTYLLSL
jgi:YVTN family beta-propeller protein